MKKITFVLIAIICITSNILAQSNIEMVRQLDLHLSLNSTIPLKTKTTLLNQDYFKLKPGYNYCFGINYNHSANNSKLGYFIGVDLQSFKYKIKVLNPPGNNFKISSTAFCGFFSGDIPFGIRFKVTEHFFLNFGIVPSYEILRLQSLYSYGISSQTIDSFNYSEKIEAENKGYLNFKSLFGVEYKVSERFHVYSKISTSFIKSPDFKYILEINYENNLIKLEGTTSPLLNIICFGVKYYFGFSEKVKQI